MYIQTNTHTFFCLFQAKGDTMNAIIKNIFALITITMIFGLLATACGNATDDGGTQPTEDSYNNEDITSSSSSGTTSSTSSSGVTTQDSSDPPDETVADTLDPPDPCAGYELFDTHPLQCCAFGGSCSFTDCRIEADSDTSMCYISCEYTHNEWFPVEGGHFTVDKEGTPPRFYNELHECKVMMN